MKKEQMTVKALRIYKPDGSRLEFILGSQDFEEGIIEKIEIRFGYRNCEIPVVSYSNKTEAAFYGFPFALHYL